ncbi:MAG: hypothetical protein QM804_15755 [Propionicimonas sp.]
MKRVLLGMLSGVVLAGALVLSATPAVAAPRSQSYVCKGGVIPAGTYRELVVAGGCAVAPNATITVKGNVKVQAGAMLDAHSAPSTLVIGGSVLGARGSFVALGCQPPEQTGNSAHACANDPAGASDITVKGSILLDRPIAVMLNGLKVSGSVSVLGGGSDIPWSIKNNQIRGSVVVIGSTTWWIGVMFNDIRGSVLLHHITITDQDGELEQTFVVRNKIRHFLSCTQLPQGVFGYGNDIGGRGFGLCANPALTGDAPW